MGVVIEICAKYPGGRTRMTVTGVYNYAHRLCLEKLLPQRVF
jgi:hypothetical protein